MLSSPTPRRRMFIERLKWLFLNLACAFVPSKKYRELIRYSALRYRIRPGRPPLPVKKRPAPINIAFCFDSHFVRQAGVTMASLLANSKNRTSYNIHCVVDDSVTPEGRAVLTDLVRKMDPGSTLKFLEANHDFDRCPVHRLTLGAYFRCMLPALLPELDEIIYADVDAIFLRDLIELADLDLGDNLLAGVQERPGYINSGFLVMNLARLRSEKIYDIWPETRIRMGEQLQGHDQDLLNLTCQGRILFLPVKYNFFHYMYPHLYRRGGIAPQDHHELKYEVVMVHYACGVPKPWREKRFYMSTLWWEYARLTPFYEELRAELKT